MMNRMLEAKNLYVIPGLYILVTWVLTMAFDHSVVGDAVAILSGVGFWVLVVGTPFCLGFAGHELTSFWKMVGWTLSAIGLVAMMTLMGVGMGSEGPGMAPILLPGVAIACAVYCPLARAIFHLGAMCSRRLRGSKAR